MKPNTVIPVVYTRSVRQLVVAGIAAFAATANTLAAGSVTIDSDISPMVPTSEVLAHVDLSTPINSVFVLPLRDPIAAENYAIRVNTPGDPLYQQFLTPEQFGAKFGPSETDHDAVLTWAKSNGLQLGELSRSKTTLSLNGTAAQFEALLQTRINNYRAPDGRLYYSAAIAPSIPETVAPQVRGIIGLSSYNRFAPLYRVHQARPGSRPLSAGGTGPLGAYSASDLRTAYQIPRFPEVSKFGTVAIYEQGGFTASDVAEYEEQNKLPAVPVKIRSVNGSNGSAKDPNIELEAVLDIDMVIGINPKVSQVLVYEDADSAFGTSLVNALTAVANDNTARTLSISYGLDEGVQGNAQIAAEGVLFQQLASQGITVFVAAGDRGAYGASGVGDGGGPVSLNVVDPGSQPFVTAVGGTALFTGANQVYGHEEVWNTLGEKTQFSNAGDGSGGGVSTVWKIPSYQLNPSLKHGTSVASANGGSAKMRNIPDVTADGSPDTGVAVFSAVNGGWLQIGGTSASAPIWAGFSSVVDSALGYVGHGRVGFLNPFLYQLVFNQENGLLINQILDINDIVDGTNGNALLLGIPGFFAGPGYDNCSGWGSMKGGRLAADILVAGAVLTPGKTPAAPQVQTVTVGSTSIDFKWNAVPLATGYIFQALTVDSNFDILTNVAFVTRKTTIKLTPLTPNTTYIISAAAVNEHGSGVDNLPTITTAAK
jgi:subtilase family serine protease